MVRFSAGVLVLGGSMSGDRGVEDLEISAGEMDSGSEAHQEEDRESGGQCGFPSPLRRCLKTVRETAKLKKRHAQLSKQVADARQSRNI